MPAFSEQRPTALPYKAPMGLAESLKMRQNTPVATPSVTARKVRSDIALQVVANPSTNSLLVKGRTEHIAFVKQLIAQLDQPKRHIELSVWIIDLEKTAL
ncbi:secretin N-terminal domain-containing protein, partial [Candidatus Regiella insecticola]